MKVLNQMSHKCPGFVYDDLWKYWFVLCCLYFSPPFTTRRWLGHWLVKRKVFQANFASYLLQKAERVEKLIVGVLEEDKREGERFFPRQKRVRILFFHDDLSQEKWQHHRKYVFQPY